MRPSHLVVILILALLGHQGGFSKDIVVEPKGVYKTIDVRLANDTIKALQGGRAKTRSEHIKKILGAPENYAPPVLFLLSSILFEDNRKDEAMFWFYAGQLRARIDANLCTDQSAASAVGVLNEKFGSPINQHAFKDIQKLKQTVKKVVEWEEKAGCNYDRRWINLHGMQAFNPDSSLPLSKPQQDWETIRTKTRAEYLTSFYAAMDALQMKN